MFVYFLFFFFPFFPFLYLFYLDCFFLLSSSFSTDLISTTAFQYIKAPRDRAQEEADAQKVIDKKRTVIEDGSSEVTTKESKDGENFVYRMKKDGVNASGGYKIVSEKVSSASSREK